MKLGQDEFLEPFVQRNAKDGNCQNEFEIFFI